MTIGDSDSSNRNKVLDALVVGAGPTGLAMALDLQRYGMNYRIIEKAAGPTDLSKATVVMPRTTEEFAPRGLSKDIIAAGERSISLSTYSHGKMIFHSVYDHLATDYSFLINVPQSSTERVLREHLEKAGGKINWNTELVSFNQDDTGVDVVLKTADGKTEHVRTAWLVGCDGAHSALRHALEIPFEGAAYKNNWLLADVHIDWRFPHGHTYLFFQEDGLLAVFPMPDKRHRIYVVRLEQEALGRQPTLEDFQELADTYVPDGCELSDPRWLSEFHCHHRRIKHYGKGRAMLAGDAAHVHSPESGLGMNTGIQDAFNLAWKIAYVQKGLVSSELMESYNLERSYVGKEVLKLSDRTHKIWAQFGKFAETIRAPMWRLFSSFFAHHHASLEEAVQIRIHYPEGVFTEHHGHPDSVHPINPPVEAGMRAINGPLHRSDIQEELPGGLASLFDALRFKLILFTGSHPGEEITGVLAELLETAAQYPAQIDSIIIHGGQNPSLYSGLDAELYVDPTLHLHFRYAAQAGGIFLVRPDLYVGFSSHRLDNGKLKKYLGNLFEKSAS